MTTDPDERLARIAALKASRSGSGSTDPSIDPTPTANRFRDRRSTLGKVWATGLTATSIMSITAVLGVNARNAAADQSPVPPADTTGSGQPRLVLDVASGQLITYVDDVAVASQQVLAPVGGSSSPATPSPVVTSTPLPDLSGFATTTSISVQTSGQVRIPTASPAPTVASPSVPVTTAAPSPTPESTSPVTVAPIAPSITMPVTAPVTAAPVTAAPTPPPPPTTPPTTQAPSSGSH